MDRPSEDELVAMVRLNAYQEFKVFRQWIERSLASADKDCRRKKGEELYRAQGEALCLEELVEKCDSARDSVSQRRAIRAGKPLKT